MFQAYFKGMDADVIVIGAGAAGLAAARSLVARSLRTIVLDARDRVGGRAWSRVVTRTAVPAEFGAEFIHGRARETMALLREAGTAAVDLGDRQGWTCFRDGTLRQTDDDSFSSAAGIFDGARSLPKDETVDTYLKRYAGDESCRERVATARAFVEGFDAADPAIASARAIAEEWRSGTDSFVARPIGGYRIPFDRLHKTCLAAGVQLHLSTAVRRISWRRGEVAVEAQDATGKQFTLRARTALVTLPAGVLRSTSGDGTVAFEPDIPAAKREALRSIEMGHVARVVLWFRTAFWERIRDEPYRDAAFFRCQDRPFTAYWTQLPVRSELIVAWAGGPRAIALSDTSPAELISYARDDFGAMLGELNLARKEFKGGITHDWASDPYSRGAYSYVLAGGGNAREVLAAPVDDALFFAGEATSTDGQGGTVNGALETGERAAREVAVALGASGSTPEANAHAR